MPLGDAQRTWFPEMVKRLRSEWHEGLSMSGLIGLRDELDGTLHRIRASRLFVRVESHTLEIGEHCGVFQDRSCFG
jgi:hypothetical protein